MSDTSNALLQQAYTHIENDELETAQEILAPLLEQDANSAHLWWVYAHAVRDAAIGQAALERVLALDPQYPGAGELKADVLEAQSKDPDLIALEVGESKAEATTPPFDIDDWEDLQPAVESNPGGSSSRGRVVLLLVLLIVVAGGAIVISGTVDFEQLLAGAPPSLEPQVVIIVEPPSQQDSSNLEDLTAPEPAAATAVAEPVVAAATPLADEATPTVTATATVENLTALETEAPTAASFITPAATINADFANISSYVESVTEQIAELPILPLKSGVLPTRLGNTLVIVVCAVPGPEYNARLKSVLTTVVSLMEDLPKEIEAAAAGLINCEYEQAPLRIIGVGRETLEAFANEAMNDKEFQRAWQLLS